MTNEELIGLYVSGRLSKEMFVNIINLKSVLVNIDNGKQLSDEYMKVFLATLYPDAPAEKSPTKAKTNG